MKKVCYLYVLTCFILLIFSCAGNYGVSQEKAITGYWKNEKDIYLSIEPTKKYGIAALIKFAPGYAASEDFKSGKPLVVNIIPLADGSYSGLFLIEKSKGMKVRLAFTSPGVLTVVTWDKRAQGRIMKWVKVRNKEEIDFLDSQ